MIEKIFLLHGKARSGKNFTAEIMKQEYEKQGKKVLICGFADPVKDTMTRYFGITDFKSAEGRTAIQHYATDICRTENAFTWAKIMSTWLYAVRKLFDVVIFADWRFLSEREQIVWDWYSVGCDVKTVQILRGGENWSDLNEVQKSHQSETELDNYKNFDYTIYNDKDKEYIREQVEKIL